MFDLKRYLGERLPLVDDALASYLRAEGGPPRLVEAMGYSLMAGGKRLRPIMVLAAAELAGGKAADVLPAACAVEYVHTYSLIHDDLPSMDDDDYRRGRLTNHKVYGEGMAVLAGDALLTRAFGLVAACAPVCGAERTLAAVAELSRAAGQMGMVGGQVEDLDWEGKETPPAVLQNIHALKTGAMFRACLRMGATLAGASGTVLSALDEYARQYGLAFQIIDDVLDVVGDFDKIGKPVGSDVKNDKSTYVKQYGLDGARQRAEAAAAAAAAAVAGFGYGAAPLQALAGYVVSRES